MAGKRKRKGLRPRSRQQQFVRLRETGPGEWELEHPRCVRARKPDIDEVYQMIAHGEYELAEDELRWLLKGCSSFIQAHMLLGKLVEAQQRWDLARAHFAYGYELGLRAVSQQPPGRIPFDRPANRPWFEAGAGLVRVLIRLGQPAVAEEVVRMLQRCDPTAELRQCQPLPPPCGDEDTGSGNASRADLSTDAQ
jgi:hypothetical protein